MSEISSLIKVMESRNGLPGEHIFRDDSKLKRVDTLICHGIKPWLARETIEMYRLKIKEEASLLYRLLPPPVFTLDQLSRAFRAGIRLDGKSFVDLWLVRDASMKCQVSLLEPLGYERQSKLRHLECERLLLQISEAADFFIDQIGEDIVVIVFKSPVKARQATVIARAVQSFQNKYKGAELSFERMKYSIIQTQALVI